MGTLGNRETIALRAYLLMMVCLASGACGPKRVAEVSSPHPPAAGASFQLPPTPPDEDTLNEALARLAQEPSPERHREVGIFYQNLSPPDRWEYLDRAIEHLKQAEAGLPQDPKTLFFLGLSKAAKARDPAVSMFAKLSQARQGFRFMDQAVALEPGNFSMRLLRAKAQLLTPPILGRSAILKADRHQIHDWVADEDLARHLKAMGYLFLGDFEDRIHRDREQATRFWQQARRVGEGLPIADLAKTRLAGSGFQF